MTIINVSIEGVTLALTQLQQCAKPTQPPPFSPNTTPLPPPPSSSLLSLSLLPTPSSSLSATPSPLEDQEIWIHLGVNSQQNGFRLEKVAWNGICFFHIFLFIFIYYSLFLFFPLVPSPSEYSYSHLSQRQPSACLINEEPNHKTRRFTLTPPPSPPSTPHSSSTPSPPPSRNLASPRRPQRTPAGSCVTTFNILLAYFNTVIYYYFYTFLFIYLFIYYF